MVLERENLITLLKKYLMSCNSERKKISPRVIWLKLRDRRKKWVFVSAYNPWSEKGSKLKIDSMKNCLTGRFQYN